MSDIAKGVLGSLIAAALIAGGGWLSTVMVKEEVALFIRTNQLKLGPLVVWDLEFANYNEYALDEVKISIPTQSIVRAEFDRSTGVTKEEGADRYYWKGELEKHGTFKVLAIFESSNMVFSDERLKDVAHAKYRIRDESTGTLKWQAVPVLHGSEPTTSRTILKIFWFLLPIGLAALVSFGWLAVVRFIRKDKEDAKEDNG